MKLRETIQMYYTGVPYKHIVNKILGKHWDENQFLITGSFLKAGSL